MGTPGEEEFFLFYWFDWFNPFEEEKSTMKEFARITSRCSKAA
jgi:hypothetical protein